MSHVSVLLHESIDNLSLRKGSIFLDGTLGSAGHSAEVARRFGSLVKIIGLDRDPDALRRSTEKLQSLNADAKLKNENFRNLDKALSELDIEKVDAILLDLGLSSDQLESSGRGFSFQKEEPLLMTMGKNDLSAREILNTFDEATIEIILRGFGEERYSRRIAKEIVRRREIKPFETTEDLLEAIRAATPASYSRSKINPATRTFQALRIAVNAELDALEEGLEKGFSHLSKNGRFAVISFHSLEDRIVKNFFRNKEKEGEAKLINKKPIIPSEEEVAENPRSRSAKLRVIEKTI